MRGKTETDFQVTDSEMEDTEGKDAENTDMRKAQGMSLRELPSKNLASFGTPRLASPILCYHGNINTSDTCLATVEIVHKILNTH